MMKCAEDGVCFNDSNPLSHTRDRQRYASWSTNSRRIDPICLASAPLRQNRPVEKGKISDSSEPSGFVATDVFPMLDMRLIRSLKRLRQIVKLTEVDNAP